MGTKVSTARMFLAEAMNLHAERLRLARERVHRLANDLEEARMDLTTKDAAYEAFKRYITSENF
jgi:hypothetical protein